MSKVSISGDQNGTGNFTIKAPATNTDRTLTIPDSDGEFLFTDSNGDLSVDGDIKITATNARFNAGIDGSATNPTFVVNDGDTGLFRASNNALGFTTGGSEAARFDSSGNLLVGKTDKTGHTNSVEIDGSIASFGVTAQNVSGSYVNSGLVFGNGRYVYLVTVKGAASGNAYSTALFVLTAGSYDKELVRLGDASNHFGNGYIQATLDSGSSSSVNFQVRWSNGNTGDIDINVLQLI